MPPPLPTRQMLSTFLYDKVVLALMSQCCGATCIWAVCALGYEEVAAVLLDAGASRGLKRIEINANDICGLTALDYARRMNHDNTVAFLKDRGALESRKSQVSKLSYDWELRHLDAVISYPPPLRMNTSLSRGTLLKKRKRANVCKSRQFTVRTRDLVQNFALLYPSIGDSPLSRHNY